MLYVYMQNSYTHAHIYATYMHTLCSYICYIYNYKCIVISIIYIIHCFIYSFTYCIYKVYILCIASYYCNILYIYIYDGILLGKVQQTYMQEVQPVWLSFCPW